MIARPTKSTDYADLSLCYQDEENHSSLEYNAYVNQTKLWDQILDQCHDKDVCIPKINYEDILNDGFVPKLSVIFRPDTIIFAQVACTQQGGEIGYNMWVKRYLGLFIATIGVFMAIYFRFTMTYIQRALSLRVASLEYDHVAIEDYSVTGKIKRSFYDRVVKQQSSSDGNDRPPIEILSEYLTTEIERHLKDKGHLNPKVANIEYSFNNTKMVIFLKKRHKLLKKGKFKDAEKIEEKMTKFKNDYFDELNVPNTFWCTFMDAESKRKILA